MSAPLQTKAPSQAAASAAKGGNTYWRVSKDRVKLALDVGGVLSNKDVFGAEPYQSAMKGAFAFIVLFGRKYGFHNVFICSRVNKLPSRGRLHWVERFLRQMGICEVRDGGFGIPDSNVALCTKMWGRDGKGAIMRQGVRGGHHGLRGRQPRLPVERGM